MPPTVVHQSHEGGASSSYIPIHVVFGEGALASIGATVVSNPFEVMKTRLQLQGELMKKGSYHQKYNGMLSGMSKVAGQEGLLALQKGLWASMIHQVVQNGLRFAIYPQFQAHLKRINDDQPGFGVNVLSGCLAGLIGAVVSNPFMMVKTRLQSSSSHVPSGMKEAAIGHQHHYKGVFDGLRQIVNEGGVRGLWFGVKPAMYRTVVLSSAQLATYDGVKEAASLRLGLSNTDVKVHFIAGAASAFAVMVTMNPLDVILTRSYNNGSQHIKAKATSVPGIMKEIVAVEGVQGLYKGSLALWSRLAPHFICTFVFLEQIRAARQAAQPYIDTLNRSV